MSNLPNWEAIFQSKLIGKVIKNVRYMGVKEARSQGFWQQPLVIEFSDGTYLFPMQDEEGNGPGVLVLGDSREKTEEIIPVMDKNQ